MKTDAQRERNRRLTRLLYDVDRERILRHKKRYYRENRARICAKQAEYRAAHPFVNTPRRRKYMRVYMRGWRAR